MSGIHWMWSRDVWWMSWHCLMGLWGQFQAFVTLLHKIANSRCIHFFITTCVLGQLNICTDKVVLRSRNAWLAKSIRQIRPNLLIKSMIFLPAVSPRLHFVIIPHQVVSQTIMSLETQNSSEKIFCSLSAMEMFSIRISLWGD